MSPTPPPSTASQLALVVGVVTLFCFTIAAAVVIHVATPDTDTSGLITILLGQLAPTIAVLVLLGKTQTTAAQVAAVATDTRRLTNGLLDAKIRAGVADVLDESLIDREAVQQIATDRRHRDVFSGPHDDGGV